MAKSFSSRLLKNNLGQSAVEYILLLAVISSLTYTFYNNKKFKDLMAGKDGMFASMKKGMGYSYRYGLEYSSSVPVEIKMQFEYGSNAHDTYFNGSDGHSHFFTGTDAYPKNP
ncbi:MAG: hypothetical protein Q7U04_11220 [Bacteriovorax sp.]|nr:hypothetical protein [Bacteriovorax sp.]